MPIPTLRATVKIAWRARHLALGPWGRVEDVRGTFALGVGALVASALLFLITLLTLLVALLVEPWRAAALWSALAGALLALGAFALGLWLLLVRLPRLVQSLLAWARDAPANARAGADEFVRIVRDVEAEETRRGR